ncbi:hypothetical protein ACRAWD_30850 [Caulobacter segnis]
MRETSKLDVGGLSLRGELLLHTGRRRSRSPSAPRPARKVGRPHGRRRAGRGQGLHLVQLLGYGRLSYSVKEAPPRRSAGVPVVRDVPVFNKLEVNAAARVSDYNTTGSIWSWKLGATNEFFPGFRGRITKSRDIRSALTRPSSSPRARPATTSDLRRPEDQFQRLRADQRRR